MFAELFREELNLIEMHLRSLMQWENDNPPIELAKFYKSFEYSIFSGGKRFRPLLSVLTAKALGATPEAVLPLASAVELIHTYSLIHDDLPCMDDDDMRRGQPTHHKKFGEAEALLAGDALLTMAFGVLAQSPSPAAARVVSLLSLAAGPRGMVGGQVLDLQSEGPDELRLREIHRLKTGALISVSVVGAALLGSASSAQIEGLQKYGDSLGLAFQIADDIQDYDPDKPEKINFANIFGLPDTGRRLSEASQQALNAIAGFSTKADGLRKMVQLNQERV